MPKAFLRACRLRAFMEAAAQYKVRAIIAQVHDPAEIENAITKLGGETGSGLIQRYPSSWVPSATPSAAVS